MSGGNSTGQGGRTNRERKTRAGQDTRDTVSQGTLNSPQPPGAPPTNKEVNTVKKKMFEIVMKAKSAHSAALQALGFSKWAIRDRSPIHHLLTVAAFKLAQ